MFAEIQDRLAFSGYRKVAITGFCRLENHNLIYGDREYELTLADGKVVKCVLKQKEWEILESNSIKIF